MGNKKTNPDVNKNVNDNKQDKKKNGLIRLVTKRTNFGIFIAIAVIAFVLLNLLAQFIPNIDATTGGIFTLTKTTEDVLNGLDQNVTIYALYDEVTGRSDVGAKGRAEQMGILDKYDAFSKVKVEYVDLDKRPGFLKSVVGEEKAANYSKNDYLIKCGDKVRHVSTSEIYSTVAYEDTENYYGTQIYTTGIKLETKLTSAIIKVTSETPVICYSTGFGEYKQSRFSHLLDYIGYNGYDIEEINLKEQTIPENAVCIVFMGPKEDMGSTVSENLKKWLGEGNAAFFFMDVQDYDSGNMIYNDFTNFRSIFKEFGLDIEKTKIDESNERKLINQSGDNIFYAETLSTGALENLKNLKVNIKNTRSIDVTEKKGQYDTFTPAAIIKTSRDAKIESVENENKSYVSEAVIAASSEAYTSYSTKVNAMAKIVLFGSSQSFMNAFLEEFGTESARQIMNESMRWMELDIKANVADSIEAKQYNNGVKSAVVVTQNEMTAITIVVMIVVPLLIIAAGFIIWLYRRHM